MDPSESRGPREGAWEMTPGEKLMAQWEAQHDVAARGHRCDPLGVQHQLSRARVAERTHAHAPHPRRTGSTAAGSTPGTPAVGTVSGTAAATRPPEVASAHETPAHETPAHGDPRHETPRQTPRHEAPRHEAPRHEAPRHEAPIERRHPWLHRLTRRGGRP
ncbi:hypothetical protein [Geodermatophilus maliterrae]|uniref:Uncharacterized protein n=1 Tax=Geodermatophilus maliterrae TaxID=3162531 RepID=A0ABV3XFU6_9ACTN